MQHWLECPILVMLPESNWTNAPQNSLTWQTRWHCTITHSWSTGYPDHKPDLIWVKAPSDLWNHYFIGDSRHVGGLVDFIMQHNNCCSLDRSSCLLSCHLLSVIPLLIPILHTALDSSTKFSAVLCLLKWQFYRNHHKKKKVYTWLQFVSLLLCIMYVCKINIQSWPWMFLKFELKAFSCVPASNSMWTNYKWCNRNVYCSTNYLT